MSHKHTRTSLSHRRSPTQCAAPFNCSSKRFDDNFFVTPSPCQYNTATPTRIVGGYLQSNSRRDIYRIDDNPGPGAYGKITEWFRPSTAVKSSKPTRKTQKVQLMNYLDEKGRFIRKDEVKRDENDIGPGTYNSDMPYHPRTHKISDYRPKTSIDTSQVMYFPRVESTKMKIKIGERHYTKQQKYSTSSIGLPHTEYRFKRNATPQFMLTEVQHRAIDNEEHNTSTVPNFSKNTAHIHAFAKPSTPFGCKGYRFKDNSTDTPGPGQYNIKSSIVPSDRPGAMNYTHMIGPKPPDYNVGPGQYSLPSSIVIRKGSSPQFSSTVPGHQ